MSQNLFAIILVSYDRGEITRRCVESIRSVTQHSYQIIVVDNGSQETAATRILNELEAQSDISLIRLPDNRGPAAARNMGMSMADKRCPYMALFDNDIVALEGWDHATKQALDGPYDLIQPKLLESDGVTVERGPNVERTGGLAANPEYVGRGVARTDLTVSTRGECSIVGTAAVLKREVYESIGEMDERLHIGEDFDYSFRARAAGFRLGYVPDVELIHDHGFDLDYEQERSRVVKYLTAHVTFWRKHRRALLSPAYLAWYCWLHFNGEPMYLPPGMKCRNLRQRLRRRYHRKRCMEAYGNEWSSEEAADSATEGLARRLGMKD